MSDENNDDELKTRRGVFLKVEMARDTVIETSVKGERSTFAKQLRPETITVCDLRISQSVDLKTGEGKYFVAGRTKAKLRAIGTEDAYQRDVRISSELPTNRMQITKSYAKDGHSLGDIGNCIVVGVSDRAVETIVKEVRGAPSPRNLDIALAQPSFFGPEKSAREGFLNHDVLLPYWSDQAKHPNAGGVKVEWNFDVEGVSVVPEFRHFGDERPNTASPKSVHAKITDPVRFYYGPPSEDNASLDALITRLIEAIRMIESLKIPMYVTAIAAALIAYKLLWGSH